MTDRPEDQPASSPSTAPPSKAESRDWSGSSLKQKVFLLLIGAVLTQLINFAAQQYSQRLAKPILVRDVNQADLSNLPLEIKKQIPLVPVKYTLQHVSGAAAKNVTINITFTTLVNAQDLTFSADSEPHQISAGDFHTLRVDIPTLRPNGLVSFQIIAPPTNEIQFAELSENATFLKSKDAQSAKARTTLIQIAVIGTIIIALILLYYFIARTIWRIGRRWRDFDTGTSTNDIRPGLITCIVAVLIYNVLLNAFGPLQVWLPLPHINLSDITDAVLLYLLITRFKLIDKWLSMKVQPTDQPPERRDK